MAYAVRSCNTRNSGRKRFVTRNQQRKGETEYGTFRENVSKRELE